MKTLVNKMKIKCWCCVEIDGVSIEQHEVMNNIMIPVQ